jgi:hypothetical protein
MMLLFRRKDCAEQTATALLRGIDPEARYEVSSVDATTTETMRGAELARSSVAVPLAPGSALRGLIGDRAPARWLPACPWLI